jgi:hypothetical protein
MRAPRRYGDVNADGLAVKLRRVRADDRLEIQSLGDDGSWQPASDRQALGGVVFDHAWEMAICERQLAMSEHLLPFQPASFRDFLLYEKHNINAARGLVQRFHPGQSRVTRAVETLTRRPFPLFKPKPFLVSEQK